MVRGRVRHAPPGPTQRYVPGIHFEVDAASSLAGVLCLGVLQGHHGHAAQDVDRVEEEGEEESTGHLGAASLRHQRLFLQGRERESVHETFGLPVVLV